MSAPRALELLDDALVAAIDVVHAVNDGIARSSRPARTRPALARRSEACTVVPESCAGPRTTARRASMEIFAPMRTISLACRKRFSKMVSVMSGGAFGLRCQGHVLRLHVRGEARIFLGSDIGSDKFRGAADTQCRAVDAFDRNTGLLEFGDDGA